jgi:hypothetical protein
VLPEQLFELGAGGVVAEIPDVQFTAHVKLLSLLGLADQSLYFQVRSVKGADIPAQKGRRVEEAGGTD